MTNAGVVAVFLLGVVLILAIGVTVDLVGGSHHLQPGLGRMLAPQTEEGWRNLDTKTAYWGSCDYNSPVGTGE